MENLTIKWLVGFQGKSNVQAHLLGSKRFFPWRGRFNCEIAIRVHFPLWILSMCLFRLIPIIALLTCPLAAADRPNVLLIISDDQAWSDYSFLGHPHVRTPHIDQLARQSVVFTRGYVPTALCRPSLMTLVTGHYAHRHGVTGNDPSPKYAERGFGTLPTAPA